MKKKLLSLLLALSLVTATAPSVPTFAQGAGAVPMPASAFGEKGLNVNKTVTPGSDGRCHVTLEAWTTGEIKPLDIILVLDQSERMAGYQAAMQTAVKNFIDEAAARYDAGAANHRIGIITYGDEASVNRYLTYADASGAADLKSAVDSLRTPPTGGHRNLNDAMDVADDWVAATPAQRQPIVLLFATGRPNHRALIEYDFSLENANNTLRRTHTMKTQGAQIYAVGCFNGVDPSELWSKEDFAETGQGHHSDNGEIGDHWCGDKKGEDGLLLRDVAANNRFFNYLSGNFQDAANLGLASKGPEAFRCLKTGWRITENAARTADGYYLSYNNPIVTGGLFSYVLGRLQTPDIDLDAGAIVQDTVTSYFSISGEAACSIVPFDGTAFDGTAKDDAPDGVTASVSGQTVSVTGFDFNSHVISQAAKADGTHGRKLVVEFDIVPKEGFMGGAGIPTNTADSGVYKDGALIKGFEVPRVNMAIRYSLNLENQTIFLGAQADLAASVSHADPFLPNGVNNAFVTIQYTLTDPSGTLLGTYTVSPGASNGSWAWTGDGTPALTQDTTYTVTAWVSSDAPDTVPSWSNENGPKTFTVIVASGTLAISKTGAAGETGVFHIYKDGSAAPYMTVTVRDGQPTTIVGLPQGSYRVEADAARLWRYGAPVCAGSDTAAISAGTPNACVACAFGEPVNTRWLDGCDEEINTAKGGSR